MDSLFGNLLNALGEIWKNIGIAQKVSIVLTVVATLGACALVLYFGTRPDWQILYADMDPKQAAKVYDLVSGAGIQVKLTDSGRTIMVPAKEVYKMRLKVAGEGLQPTAVSSGGWETFDKLPLGATDLQQQLAKQRALQGELEKMINQMPGVASSRVMLTLPQKSVFKKDKLRPSASVMVSLQQGAMLGGQEVNGIRCLISGSVAGMVPDDVTITDNRGNLLARQTSSEDGSIDGSDRYMDMQSKTERVLKEKAEAILRPIVGIDNVVAMVTCDMDFDSVDEIKEDYDPDKAVVVTDKSVTEDINKNSGLSVARGGAGANMPTNTETVDVNNPSAKPPEEKSTKEQKVASERTFVVPKTVRKTVNKAGRVKNLSVAVTVGRKPDGKSWSKEEKDNFQSLVATAVGAGIYSVGATGPLVTVKEMDFFKGEKVEYKAGLLEKVNEGISAIGNSNAIRPLLGLGLLAVLFLVFKMYFSKGGAEGGDIASANAVFSEEVRQLPSEAMAADEQRHSELADALQAKATASPQAVASLMENWLSQDQPQG